MWDWSEAFYKFGFDDGEGNVHTPLVAATLECAGYQVKYSRWSPHNTIIYSIQKNGVEIMPVCKHKYRIGYDHARTYLPDDIIKLLDEAFPF